MARIVLGAALIAASCVAVAQQLSERPQGLRDETPRWHALTGARLVLAPGQVVERGTVVLRDGQIVAAGADVPVPAGARVWALPGRTIYAGFIDMGSTLGQPRSDTVPAATAAAPAPAAGAAPAPRRWVQPDTRQANRLELRADELRMARELGFTTALSAPASGIFRGQSALVNLQDGGPDGRADARAQLLAADVAQHLANDFERARVASYPNSLMGSIALVRQTWWNARWYGQPTPAGAERREFNAALAALQPALAGRQPVIYAAADEQDYARIAKVRDEFGLKVIAQGNGHEYRRAAELKRLAMPVIVPLNYPAAPEVEQPDAALDVSLQQLQHWEQAPSNLALLQRAGVEFGLATQGLRDARREFWPRLRQAVRRGLAPDAALAALTTTPARLLGQPRLGRIAPGQFANLVVASGDLFASERAEVELAFVDGWPFATEAWERFDARGAWRVRAADGATHDWTIAGTAERPTLQIGGKDCAPLQRGRELSLRWPCDAPAGAQQTLLLTGRGDAMTGSLALADGRHAAWSAARTAPHAAADVVKPEPLPQDAPTSPAGAFGRSAAPERPAAVLVRNATLWTSAAAGRLDGADLLVRDGRIAAIGRGLAAPAGALVVDAAGRHVTPGLVDAHSHTAVAHGVNEASHSITAEVRIGDVIDATDVNIYRQLAGGVTAANLLHGSANTIGGQNQVVKLRWGSDAEGLKLAGAMPGIKFALGENVKQSNWGEANVTRYPQTRMGVEQVLRDGFLAAKTYRDEWAAWRKDPKRHAEPRRDLRMDTLVELLERRRAIHIHSYRADEILMFTRIAREFGLDVATFQHVLEGYKVAPEIAAIGAGGSTFSDWWAYKMEVQDAIPANGVMMARAGVLTSFNSDSDELARRLNTEAAKAVRHGGLSEAEALAFVTINPAKQLRIAGQTGSLEVGKDADFVIWNAHPLSTAARADETWIEGRRYFDRASDAALRERDRAERARLVALALPARLTAIAAQAAREAAAPATAATERAPTYEELLEWIHQLGRHHHSYWNGADRHECTEDH